MEVGNVSQTIMRRSVLKQLQNQTFDPQERCQIIPTEHDEVAATSSALAHGNQPSIVIYAIAKALNDLATRGAKAVAVSLQINLPPRVREVRLKEMIQMAESFCRELHVEIRGVQVEVMSFVSQFFVQATAMGTAKEQELMSIRAVKPGQEIVLCGYIGIEGMLRVVDEKEEELSKRFIPTFINQIKELKALLAPLAVIDQAKAETVAMHQVGNGGIFAALWELGEAAKVGMELTMSRISVKQETIEVCECYHLDPYHMTSTGTILMITEDADRLIQRLQQVGAHGSNLGMTTAEKARFLMQGEEKRFLDRPAQDELVRFDTVNR